MICFKRSQDSARRHDEAETELRLCEERSDEADSTPKVNVISKQLKKFSITYIIILILLTILPINGTSSTLNNTYTFNIRWDYIIHALVYIPLIPLLSFYKQSSRPIASSKTLAIILISIFIAITLESIQYIIPWRTFNINDMFSNVLGVGIGFVLMKLFERIIYERN